MTQARPLIHSLNNGEISISALARVDQEKAKLWAETQENLMPFTIGKAMMRPGTTYLGASAINNKARGIEFVKSIDATAGLELTDAKLRVWVNDALVTRGAVTSTVTSGDFASATGWTLATLGGATATIADDQLTLAAPYRGGEASARQEVTTSNLGDAHALRIEVTRGPVVFRCGATEFGDEYIGETALDTGTHSLAFTPTGIAGGTDAFTKLLLHCNGADGSTTFTDSSSVPHTVTVNDNAQIDTAQSKFGGASGLFDGNLDRLSLDGSADFAFGTGDFTIEMWFRLNAGGAQILYDGRPSGTNGAYPTLNVTSGNVLAYFVQGANAIVSSTTLSTGTWYHAAVTRSGTTTRLFLNGVLQGSFTDTTAYLNVASRPFIGANGTNGAVNEVNGWIDEVRVSKGVARWISSFSPPAAAYGGAGDTYWVQFSTKRETNVIVGSIQVEAAGVMELPAPWQEDQLNAIQYDQSGDIVFLAHTDWQQRKIERRGDASWSIVLYKADDGPFTTSRTANVRLTPGATRGNTTLSADGQFFRSDHVGALFKLTHSQFNADFGLAGADRYTDAIRVSGIGTDNDFTVTRSSTWVGTLRLQRSYDGREVGFINTGTTYTTTGSSAFAPGSTFDNIIQYYRVGFGSTDYTSGTAIVGLTYSGDSGFGVCRVTEYVSPTQVNIEVLSDFKNTTPTDNWQEGEWSDRRGWPSAVMFADGRLVWQRDDKFRASESDSFVAFNLETEGDSGSIQRDVATSSAVFKCNALLSLSRPVILTDGAEVCGRSDAFDTPITPTNISFKNASTVGSGPYSPEKVDKQGFYIAISGVKLYKLVYNFEQQDYDSDDVTELHEDLGEDHGGFKEIAVQRHPQPWLWCPMGDGQAAVLLHSPKHQLSGWVRVITDGEIESIYVLPEATEHRVYLWVKRTINGQTVRFHEKLALRGQARGRAITKLADAGVFVTSGPVTSVTAAHLANETGLIAWGTNSATGVSGFIGTLSADGATGSLSADGSGVIALGNTYTNVFVGLPYRGRYKSAKLAYGAQGGTALLLPKRVAQIGLLLADTHRDALRVGPSFTKLTKYTIRSDSGAALDDDEAVKSVHDAITQPLGGQWSTDSRVCIQVNAGHPATIPGIVVDMET